LESLLPVGRLARHSAEIRYLLSFHVTALSNLMVQLEDTHQGLILKEDYLSLNIT